jgi:small-conductance mechanosensitive channel
MLSSQKSNPVTPARRLIAAAVFIVVAAVFVFLWLGGTGKIEMIWFFGVCGFKQSTGWPCPGCYVTSSAMEFAQGHILDAFYIQPAGALLCCGLIAAGVIAFLTAVFGRDFSFLHRPLSSKLIKYILVSLIIIFGLAWAVTLARTMAG